MRLHILGICGTFMGGLALIARQLGWQVSGSDSGIYPPMSEQLNAAGITLTQGYDTLPPSSECDTVIVGNAMTRGLPVVEQLLTEKRSLVSGPAWLYDQVLADKTVLAVAGTHGKTTTSSMLAWILDRANLEPGFLIGGVPLNFGCSARLGTGRYFVIEADEYDTAFFDKRSKFVHYRPEVLILNNLEFDHADIFDDLAAIRRQFHHLVRILPSNGLVLRHAPDDELDTLLEMGCWTSVNSFGPTGDWRYTLMDETGSHFKVWHHETEVGQVCWPLIGTFNCDNAVAALAAAAHVGVDPAVACAALSTFKSPRRRLELRGEIKGIKVYDDFAHHPTAIAATLHALRTAIPPQDRIIAVLDPASNTMRMGVHSKTLAPALQEADRIVLFQEHNLNFDLQQVADNCAHSATVSADLTTLVQTLATELQPGDHVLIMSNGAFGAIHDHLLQALTRMHNET